MNSRIMKMIPRYLVLTVAAFLLFASLDQRSSAEPRETTETRSNQLVTVPFTALRGDANYRPHQLITVNIQKDKSSPAVPATFLVDTGANACFISDTLANKLGLPQYPVIDKNSAPHVVAGQAILGIQVASLGIGGLSVEGFRFQILASQKFPHSSGQIVDGILGTDFLSFCAMHIDFARSQITFIVPRTSRLFYDTLNRNPVALSSAEIAQQGFEKALILPLIAASGGFFVNVVARNDSSVTTECLVVDTGSDTTILSEQIARKLNLKTVATETHTGLAGQILENQAWLPSLSCGDLQLTNLLVFSAPNSKLVPYETLGLDVLANYDVLLDFPHRKMCLKPRLDVQSVTLRQYQAASTSQRRQWAQTQLLVVYPAVARNLGIAIPYDLTKEGLPIAQVRPNSTTTSVPFLLRSSIEDMMISDTLAKLWQLNLETPLDDAKKPRFFDGYPLRAARLSTLQIGGALVDGEVGVLPDAALPPYTSDLPLSGVVGANFLFGRPLLMDPFTQTWIALTGLHPEDLPNLDMAEAAVVDIVNPDQDEIPAVAVQVQQNKAQFTDTMTLATGSPFTLLSAEAAKALNLTPEPQKLRYGAGKDITVFNQAHLTQLSIGGVALKDVQVAYPVGTMPDGFYPCLGMNVISKLRLLVDAPAKKLYVKKAGD